MEKLVRIMLVLLIVLAIGTSFNSAEEESSVVAVSKNYDSVLAKELGADEYGMRSYVVAFLKAGPNRDQEPDVAKKLQRAHLDNINRLAEEGKLAVAGPFLDDGNLRGIYIFNVTTIEEATELTARLLYLWMKLTKITV